MLKFVLLFPFVLIHFRIFLFQTSTRPISTSQSIHQVIILGRRTRSSRPAEAGAVDVVHVAVAVVVDAVAGDLPGVHLEVSIVSIGQFNQCWPTFANILAEISSNTSD